jgi:hypothetical protein
MTVSNNVKKYLKGAHGNNRRLLSAQTRATEDRLSLVRTRVENGQASFPEGQTLSYADQADQYRVLASNRKGSGQELFAPKIIITAFGPVKLSKNFYGQYIYQDPGVEPRKGSDPRITTRMGDFGGDETKVSAYNDILSVIKSAELSPERIARDLLLAIDNPRHSESKPSVVLTDYPDNLKKALSSFIGITQVAEETRVPGSAKLARGYLTQIAIGAESFENSFKTTTEKSPSFKPAIAYNLQGPEDKKQGKTSDRSKDPFRMALELTPDSKAAVEGMSASTTYSQLSPDLGGAPPPPFLPAGLPPLPNLPGDPK